MSRTGKCLAGIFFATTLVAGAIAAWGPISNAIYNGTGVDLRIFLSTESFVMFGGIVFIIVLTIVGLALYFSDEG